MVQDVADVGRGVPYAVPVPADGADHILSGRACRVIGWSLRESTGTANAVVRLFNGTTNNGEQVAEIGMGAGMSDHADIAEGGLWCNAGLFLNVVSGQVRGAVWIRESETGQP